MESLDDKLKLAVREGDNKLLQSVIREGAKVNLVWRTGRVSMSPIHAVVFGGFESCLKTLLEALADVNAVDECGNTPLHIAALRGKIECVKLLASANKCFINLQNLTYKTPIHGSALNGNLECIEALLLAKADVTAADVDKNTALHFASANGYFKCVNLLVASKARVDAQSVKGNTALHFSARNGELLAVDALVRAISPLKVDTRNTVARVLRKFITKDLARLISEFAVVIGSETHLRNYSGELPYDLALSNGHPDIVKYLLQWDAAEYNLLEILRCC